MGQEGFQINIENFESYPRATDVYEEFLRELGLCKGNLLAIRESMTVAKGIRSLS